MMLTVNPYEQYRRQGVMTASPGDLVVMLYDALIKHVTLAQMGIEKADAALAHTSLVRAQDILGELSMSLDLSYPISAELLDIYEFCIGELVKANVNKDAKVLPDLVEIFASLREAWAAVAKDASAHMAVAVQE